MFFADHDRSVSQAAFIFPLNDSPENVLKIRSKASAVNKKALASTKSDSGNQPAVSSMLNTAVEAVIGADDKVLSAAVVDINGKQVLPPSSMHRQLQQSDINIGQLSDSQAYPALVTLHGTGLTATSQADAYKTMPPKASEYVFGVEGFFVIAPTRFGAHNWEAVGSLSALHAVHALRDVLSHFPALPQIATSSVGSESAHDLQLVDAGVVAGHSMGGHGAWMLALANPQLALCTASAASWVRKEDYGKANAFFDLDIQNPLVDPQLISIFAQSMSEFHIDRLVSNLRGVDVNIRVGAQDFTTHPWHSRRMHRLLSQKKHSINSTLEELPGKQHWWWDTHHDNDGGALNDPKLRQFYQHCLNRYVREYKSGYRSCSSKYDRTDARNGTPLAAASAASHEKQLQKEKKVKDADGTDANHVAESGGARDRPSRCSQSSATLSLLNPASHTGLCGLRVMTQFKYQSLSTVSVDCHWFKLEEYEDAFRLGHNASVSKFVVAASAKLFRCTFTTNNVRSLRIEVPHHEFSNSSKPNYLTGYQQNQVRSVDEKDVPVTELDTFEILVDGKVMTLSGGRDAQICWTERQKEPAFCQQGVNASALHDPLQERTIDSSGPARQVSLPLIDPT
jgi:hypothetical protein